MALVKLPAMTKEEYDALIREEYIARVVFNGTPYPHVAPFIYVFDGRHMFFLSTKYGRKVSHFKTNPNVSVEVERYSPDLSSYCFVTLRGRMEQVEDDAEKKMALDLFVAMIRKKKLSRNVMVALGRLPDDPLETLTTGETTYVWKLAGIGKIVGFRK